MLKNKGSTKKFIQGMSFLEYITHVVFTGLYYCRVFQTMCCVTLVCRQRFKSVPQTFNEIRLLSLISLNVIVFAAHQYKTFLVSYLLALLFNNQETIFL